MGHSHLGMTHGRQSLAASLAAQARLVPVLSQRWHFLGCPHTNAHGYHSYWFNFSNHKHSGLIIIHNLKVGPWRTKMDPNTMTRPYSGYECTHQSRLACCSRGRRSVPQRNWHLLELHKKNIHTHLFFSLHCYTITVILFFLFLLHIFLTLHWSPRSDFFLLPRFGYHGNRCRGLVGGNIVKVGADSTDVHSWNIFK